METWLNVFKNLNKQKCEHTNQNCSSCLFNVCGTNNHTNVHLSDKLQTGVWSEMWTITSKCDSSWILVLLALASVSWFKACCCWHNSVTYAACCGLDCLMCRCCSGCKNMTLCLVMLLYYWLIKSHISIWYSKVRTTDGLIVSLLFTTEGLVQ